VSGGLVGSSGTFSLANFIKTDESSNVIADINGVALVVFYNDGNAANWRNVVLWNGNDSTIAQGADPAGWDEMRGEPLPEDASLDFIVGDGQSFDDGSIVVNGTEVVPAGGIFQGDSTPAGSGNANGDLWDVKPYTLPSGILSSGSNTLHLTSAASSDCLSLVAVAANTPASAPVIP
jgi:hypothetical protein